MTSFPYTFNPDPDWQPLTFQNPGMGPFINGTDTYILGRGLNAPENEKIKILKSSDITDPTGFSFLNLANNPQGELGIAVAMSAKKVGNKIHVAWPSGATVGIEIFYARFDMDLELWDEIDTTQIEVLIDAVDPADFLTDIIVRSNGDIVVVFSGDTEKVHGNDFERMYYSVSSDGGQTWSSTASFQDGGEINRTGGRILNNDQTDDSHVLINEDGSAFQITLNSSDVLQTYTDTGHIIPAVSGIGGAQPFASGLVVERGTESHARCLMLGNVDIPRRVPTILEFDSTPDPVGYSITEIGIEEAEIRLNQFIAALGVFSNGQLIAAWSRINPGIASTEEIFWSTDDGDVGAGDAWDTARLVASPQEDHVSGRIIDRGDGDGEKLAICWGDSFVFNYMEIEPNDFSPNTLDELGQPIEGYNLSPVIV